MDEGVCAGGLVTACKPVCEGSSFEDWGTEGKPLEGSQPGQGEGGMEYLGDLPGAS